MTKLVAIDAGHGMKTDGKRTPKLKKDLIIDGKVVRKKGEIIHEHEFNRAVAKYIAVGLARHNINYMYTADMKGNTDPALSTRSSRANRAKADILVSCHYNAIGSCASFQTRVRGLLVLRTKNCSSKSIKLGNLVHKHLRADCEYEYSYGLMRDVDMSGFTLAILRQTNMPAILIEYGFMDYEKEAVKMLDPKWQKQCAEATVKGICEYFGIKYKPEETPKHPVEKPKKETEFEPYVIKITEDTLNVRKGPGSEYDIAGVVKKGDAYTIVEEKKSKDGGKWGLLKAFKKERDGWINLKYTQKK